MHLFFQELINGLVVGSLYALVALGLALVYGTMGIPNFAHGHLYMLGAYVAFFGVTIVHIGYWPAMLLAVVVLAALGVLLERVVFRPLRDAPEVNTIIAAVGVLFFLQTLAQVFFGADFRVLPTPYEGVVRFAGLSATGAAADRDRRRGGADGAAVPLPQAHPDRRDDRGGGPGTAPARRWSGSTPTGSR